VKIAKITYVLPQDGKLQVFIAGDTQWRDIAIPASNFGITVDNDAATPMSVSHFDTYARLHKKKTANEAGIDLPDVLVSDPETCDAATTTAGVGDSVSGCSNSGWP
jgi:hypothetical protein